MESRSRWRYILRSTFKRRENWAFIPVVIMIIILILYSLYSVVITSPGRPQLSAYSDSWDDLSECRKGIKSQGFKISSIISTPSILSKFDTAEHKNMVYMAIGVERAYTDDEARDLWAFMSHGGNLIIADDFGFGNSLLDKPPNACPDIKDINFKAKQLFDTNYIKNPKFVTVRAVLNGNAYDLILNEPAALEVDRQYSSTLNIEPIAVTSENGWLDQDGNDVREANEMKGIYFVILSLRIREYGGKAIIISDPGLFINDNWQQLDNSKFIQHLLGSLLPDGGVVIFDESRHINHDTFENTRHVVYSGLVYFTSTVWSILLVVILIISFTIFIGVRLKVQPVWKNRNLLRARHFNILNYPYVSYQDYWQIYNTFLERVRLGYGFTPEEFKDLDEKTLYNLIDDRYLWDFITQSYTYYNGYFEIIIERISGWSPKMPEEHEHENVAPVAVEPLDDNDEIDDNNDNYDPLYYDDPNTGTYGQKDHEDFDYDPDRDRDLRRWR